MAQVNNAASAALTPAAAGLDFSAPAPAEAASGFPEEFLGALEEFAKREQADSQGETTSPDPASVDPNSTVPAAPLNLQILPPAALAAAAQAANLALDGSAVASSDVSGVSAVSSLSGVTTAALAAGPATSITVPANAQSAMSPISALQQDSASLTSISPNSAQIASSTASVQSEAEVSTIAAQVSPAVNAAAAEALSSTAQVAQGAQVTQAALPGAIANTSPQDAPVVHAHASVAVPGAMGAGQTERTTAAFAEAQPIQVGSTASVAGLVSSASTQSTATGVIGTPVDPSVSMPGGELTAQASSAATMEQAAAAKQPDASSSAAVSAQAVPIQAADADQRAALPAQQVEGAGSSALESLGVGGQPSTASASLAASGARATDATTLPSQPIAAGNASAATSSPVDPASLRVMALDIAKEASGPAQVTQTSVSGSMPSTGTNSLSSTSGTSGASGSAQTPAAIPVVPTTPSAVTSVAGDEKAIEASQATPLNAGGTQPQAPSFESILDPSQTTIDQRLTDAARARQSQGEPVEAVAQRSISAPSEAGMPAQLASATASAPGAASPLAVSQSASVSVQVMNTSQVTQGRADGDEAANATAPTGSVLPGSGASALASTSIVAESSSPGSQEGYAGERSFLASSAEGIVSSTTASGTFAGGDASAWVSSFTQALMGSGFGVASASPATATPTPLQSHSAPAPLPPHLVAFDTGPVQLEISRLVRQGGGQVVMELTPPDEGRFRVDLRIDSQGTATLIVEGVSDSTRSRLEQSAPDLREQFAQMGLQLELDMRGQREPSASQDHGVDNASAAPWDSRGHDESSAAPSRPEQRRRNEVHTGQVHLYA